MWIGYTFPAMAEKSAGDGLAPEQAALADALAEPIDSEYDKIILPGGELLVDYEARMKVCETGTSTDCDAEPQPVFK
jgi:hypothetical protein